jgi:3-phenylpropionate/trans-cinnamate dioxygenase ferredoxin reductase subunit
MESRYDYVLVGGGLACVWAAQSIREHDTDGKVVIIGEEPHPPYDRPPLSKNLLTDDDMTPDDPYSKLDEWYPNNNIELHTKTRVTGIDRAASTVSLDDGRTIGYGKLLLATGAHPLPLKAPGADRTGVFLLRSLDQALAIRTALQNSRRVVIVGAGYIGIEVAAAARTRGLEVTVIEPADQPWPKFASEKLGAFVRKYYEDQGVQFAFGDLVASIEGEGESGPVNAVTTKSGKRIAADMVVAGVGAAPNAELARAAGLDVSEEGGVRADEYLRTSDPSIWVAGDLARFKDATMGKEWRLEHFLNAKWQGQAVGAIMAGEGGPYDQVPYFYSDEFDIHMILRGDPAAGRNSVITGDVGGAEFTELYYDDAGRITMGIAISHLEKTLDGISDTLERLIRARKEIKGRLSEIAKPNFDLGSLG